VWRCLRDPTFSRFTGTQTCDRQTGTRLRHIPSGNYWAIVTTHKQRFALCYGSDVLSVCPVCRLSCLSITLVYCVQTVRWIKMPFGMEVALGPGDIVLDGDPAPHGKGHSSTQLFEPCRFGPCLLWRTTAAHLSYC